MKKIATIKYTDVDFKWVCDHYDFHYNGTCYYEGELCEFNTEYVPHDQELMTDIYKINKYQKAMWLYDQWKFELCVGYHWTYPYRKTKEYPKERKPVWLRKILMVLFYKDLRVLKFF